MHYKNRYPEIVNTVVAGQLSLAMLEKPGTWELLSHQSRVPQASKPGAEGLNDSWNCRCSVHIVRVKKPESDKSGGGSGCGGRRGDIDRQ